MRERQIYEFVAVDRPLTDTEMAELRAVSTRAVISSTLFRNVYAWGDLRADPRELLVRYFDVHWYMAGWGERRVVIRLPGERVDVAGVRRYLRSDAEALAVAGGFVILALSSDSESDAHEAYVEDGAGMDAATLVSVRAGLLHGDMRAPYVAWLLAVQGGWIADGVREPPVPPGLDPLPTELAALADFLGVDANLLQAASEPAGVRTAGQLRVRAEALAELAERAALAGGSEGGACAAARCRPLQLSSARASGGVTRGGGSAVRGV